MIVCAIGLSVFTSSASATDPQLIQHGRQEEQRSCIQCHSLRLVNSQRLSAAAWEKEMSKMIGWGAVVSDRQLLLDYLSQEYSDAKPMAPEELSGNGASRPKR
jgi:mono/diheme cytochrome c family protein